MPVKNLNSVCLLHFYWGWSVGTTLLGVSRDYFQFCAWGLLQIVLRVGLCECQSCALPIELPLALCGFYLYSVFLLAPDRDNSLHRTSPDSSSAHQHPLLKIHSALITKFTLYAFLASPLPCVVNIQLNRAIECQGIIEVNGFLLAERTERARGKQRHSSTFV